MRLTDIIKTSLIAGVMAYHADALEGEIVIPPGAQEHSIGVQVSDNDTYDADRTIIFAIEEGLGYTLAEPFKHTYTIKDDDEPVYEPLFPDTRDTIEVGNLGYHEGMRWLVNGQEVAQGEKLSSESTQRGDTITALLDNRDEPTQEVTIGNALPEVRDGYITLSGREKLEARAEGVDADGDAIGFLYQWQRDVGGKRIPSKTDIGWEDIPFADKNIFDYRGFEQEIVRCKITPYDSFGDGDSYETQPFHIPTKVPLDSKAGYMLAVVLAGAGAYTLKKRRDT